MTRSLAAWCLRLGLRRPRGTEAMRVSDLEVDTSHCSHPFESYFPPGRDRPLSPELGHIPTPWIHPFSQTENDLWVPGVRRKKNLKLLKQSLGSAVWETANLVESHSVLGVGSLLFGPQTLAWPWRNLGQVTDSLVDFVSLWGPKCVFLTEVNKEKKTVGT